jgi:drug/metabolite transporter (DMT)-like permease
MNKSTSTLSDQPHQFLRAFAMTKYLFIFATVILLVYAQLILKFRANVISERMANDPSSIHYVIYMLIDPFVITALAACFLSLIAWLMAIRRTEIAQAYPFVSLTFVLLPIGASIFLKETLYPLQIVASIIIVAGVILHAFAR